MDLGRRRKGRVRRAEPPGLRIARRIDEPVAGEVERWFRARFGKIRWRERAEWHIRRRVGRSGRLGGLTRAGTCRCLRGRRHADRARDQRGDEGSDGISNERGDPAMHQITQAPHSSSLSVSRSTTEVTEATEKSQCFGSVHSVCSVVIGKPRQCAHSRLLVFAPPSLAGRSVRVRPSSSVSDTKMADGSPLRTGLPTTVTLSPGLIVFDFQPARTR